MWGGLAIVLIVAALFRFWQIGGIPPGLFGDEAADGLDALDVLAGRGQIFFPGNFGREGLHMVIVAASIKALGVSPLAVRLPSALAGLLTCLATFWLGWELFAGDGRETPGHQRRRWLLALTAALYLATSFWHVHFSRFGVRGVFTTAATALTMAALWRGLNHRDWRWFLVAGLFLGLGVHFYTASRFIPILLLVFFGLWAVLYLVGWSPLPGPQSGARGPSPLRPYILGVVLMFAVAALVFAPLGYYFLTHPGSFTQHAGVVSAFTDGGQGDALRAIGRAAIANLAQFVLPGAGDQAQFYNLPGHAVFDPLTALLAGCGLLIALWRIRRPPYLFLVLWFVVMALPSFLAVDRYPTLPRLLGVIPGVYFFPAIGLVAAWQWASDRLVARPSLRCLPTLGLILALTLHAGLAARDYFGRWGNAPATIAAFEGDMTAAWQWLRAHPQPGDVYLSADIYKHPTFMFLNEQTPTSEYFTRQNPRLHWFDARFAWPLPVCGRPPCHAPRRLCASSFVYRRFASFAIATVAQRRRPPPAVERHDGCKARRAAPDCLHRAPVSARPTFLVPRWLVRPGGAGASLADERLRAADLAELSDSERLAR